MRCQRIICLLLFLLPFVLSGQEFTNRGTNFYLTFLPNYHNDITGNPEPNPALPTDSLFIFIGGAEQETQVIVEAVDINGEVDNRIYTLQPNQILRLSYPPARYELRGDNWGIIPYAESQNGRIATQRFHILSNNPVTVVGISRAIWTTDAFLAYPIDALGTEYVVMSYPSDESYFAGSLLSNQSTPSQFAVIATAPNTTVRIEPTVPIQADEEITLNEGEVYLVQADMTAQSASDLTGTRITSNHPIVVISGHQRAAIPRNIRSMPGVSSASRDILLAQLLPVSKWGKKALLFPFYPAEGQQNITEDIFRIVAAYNNTDIFINGKYVTTLFAGEVYEGFLDRPMDVEATQPIQVAQFKKTSSIVQGQIASHFGDPLFLLIPDPQQFDTSYHVVVPQFFVRQDFGPPVPVLEKFYLTFVVPNDQGIFIDPPFQQIVVPPQSIGTSDYVFFTVEVTPGTYRIAAEQPIGVFCYAYGEVESYGYVAGMRTIDIRDRYPPMITAVDSCFQIRGTVADTGEVTSGIKEVYLDENATVNVRFQSQRISRDTVAFLVSLINPYEDGMCRINGVDSLGFSVLQEFIIPGMTVHTDTSIHTDSAVVISWTIVEDISECRSFPLGNYGASPQEITGCTFRNQPSLLSVQSYPTQLQPGQIDSITVCAIGDFQFGETYQDTLIIHHPCGERKIIVFSLEIQKDTTAPRVQSISSDCDSVYTIVMYEDGVGNAGIDSVVFLQLENAVVQSFTAVHKDSVIAHLRILDPYRDALVVVEVTDLAGNVTVFRDTIQGFTISFTMESAVDTVEYSLDRRDCIEISISNHGLLPFVLDRNVWTASNFYVVIPGAQLPLVIPPGESRSLLVCPYLPQDTTIHDSLHISFRCLRMSFPLVLKSTSIVQFENNRCNVTISFRTLAVPEKGIKLGRVYPYPSSSEVVFELESDADAALEGKIFDAIGKQVDRFTVRIPQGQIQVRLSVHSLPPGLYFVVLQGENRELLRFWFAVQR